MSNVGCDWFGRNPSGGRIVVTITNGDNGDAHHNDTTIKYQLHLGATTTTTTYYYYYHYAKIL